MSAPNQLLWTVIGLLLTIGGTFVEAFATNGFWNWAEQGVQIYSLKVSFQIGAVLLAGCLGGKNAGALSQIAYIILGLTGLQVFNEGGGLEYLSQLSFGYLLGFIPGAWICGYFAFQTKPRLESLAFSCLCGLLTIHISGLTYLIVLYVVSPAGSIDKGLFEAMLTYSFSPLPGQLVVICAVTVVAFFMRKVMFY